MDRTLTAALMYQHSKSITEAYARAMQPLSEELDMPQAAVDILMFLANNPEFDTAADICKYRYLKPAIVSLYVESLVNDGYLNRLPVSGDRRKYRLVCLKKAQPVIEHGRALQQKFSAEVTQNLTEEQMEVFMQCLETFSVNIDRIKKHGLQ